MINPYKSPRACQRKNRAAESPKKAASVVLPCVLHPVTLRTYSHLTTQCFFLKSVLPEALLPAPSKFPNLLRPLMDLPSFLTMPNLLHPQLPPSLAVLPTLPLVDPPTRPPPCLRVSMSALSPLPLSLTQRNHNRHPKREALKTIGTCHPPLPLKGSRGNKRRRRPPNPPCQPRLVVIWHKSLPNTIQSPHLVPPFHQTIIQKKLLHAVSAQPSLVPPAPAPCHDQPLPLPSNPANLTHLAPMMNLR